MHFLYNKIVLIVVIAFTVLQLSSCNYAKYVADNKNILWQNRVIYEGNKIDKILREEISSQVGAAIVQKKLNTAIFGLDLETFNIGYHMPRRRLLNYNLLHKQIEIDKKTFYEKRHLAEKPVIYLPNKTIVSDSNIKTVLNNQGYFYAKVRDSVVQKAGKKVCVYYIIQAGKNFKINGRNIICNNSKIKELVESTQSQSFLKWNEPLTFSNISNERERITNLLIANGYYNMRPTAILPEVDTGFVIPDNILLDSYAGAMASFTDTTANIDNKTANITFTILDSSNAGLIQQFYINNVIVYLDKNVLSLKESKNYTEKNYKNILFRYKNLDVKEHIVATNIFVKKGDIYSNTNLEATIKRLNSFQAFSSVRVNTALSKSGKPNELDCIIELGVNELYTDKIDFEISNSPGIFGTNVRYGITNNNFLRTANLLSINAHGSLLTNIQDKKFNISQRTYGVNTDLTFPKFLLLQDVVPFNKNYLPVTKIGVGYDVFIQPSAYNQKAFNTDITYSWQFNKKFNYKVTPLFITYVETNIRNQLFFNNANPLLKSQLTNDIVLVGSNATAEYTNKLDRFQYYYSYAKFGVEKAGSIANLIGFNDFGFNKYTRFQFEGMHYINSKTTSWVNRISSFVGIPGKDNKALPLVKQTVAGGPNSMRGWGISTLGLGSAIPDSISARNILNRGDVKLEFNTEYRFKMFKLFSTIGFEGAAFVDVGNVWQYKNLNNNTNAQFAFNKLGKDLAVSGGYGLRLDFSLFIFRLDFGYKLRKPYETENNGWVAFNNLTNKTWLNNNRCWQFGFNYPF